MTDAPKPLSHLEFAGLYLLAAGPFLFLAALMLFRTGRDLSLLFFCGLTLFLVRGLQSIALGVWHRQSDQVLAGCGVLASVLVCTLCTMHVMMWQGRKVIALSVRVTDAETGQPIPGAVVRLFPYEDESVASEGRADASGTARLRHTFMTAGTSSLLGETGGINYTRETVKVEAPGYHPVRKSLGNYLQVSGDLYGPPWPTVEVPLVPNREWEDAGP